MASPPIPQPAPPMDPWRILRWRTRHLAHREPLAPGVDLLMLRIPAGSFLMGAPEEEEGSQDNERPVHRVELGEFLLGQTPVTQAQWRAVALWEPRPGEEAWRQELDPDPVGRLSDPKPFAGERRPVVNVNWHDATEFCHRLHIRTGKNYCLPSEAQWEYACRAGTTTPFHFGEMISTEVANYDGNYTYRSTTIEDGSNRNRRDNKSKPTTVYRQQTTDVGIFPANAWGLHDMHGNVWEWCNDHWNDAYHGAPEDDRPWIDEQAEDNKTMLLRGGSWLYGPRSCRSACRSRYRPGSRLTFIGFRVCCLPQA
ncbi:MAG: formylglycine-generating enzyme family protein [Cyanobacteriota bacterium]